MMPGTCNVTNTLACIIVLVTIIVETSCNEDFSQTASLTNLQLKSCYKRFH